MNTSEKTLIKGVFTKNNVLAFICLGLGIAGLLFSFVVTNDLEHLVVVSYGDDEALFYIFWISAFFLLLGLFLSFLMSFCAITVTDKRVYGKGAFGRMVDLPFDMISSVGKSAPKGLAVATSSGRIHFWLLKNQEEVYQTIAGVLIDRQNNKSSNVVTEKSDADEIRRFKELLDAGAITQEEYDLKKKQILGI